MCASDPVCIRFVNNTVSNLIKDVKVSISRGSIPTSTTWLKNENKMIYLAIYTLVNDFQLTWNVSAMMNTVVVGYVCEQFQKKSY